MWLFTTFGFFSVIQHRDDPELVLVRARVKGDLELLKKKYLSNLGEIVYMPKADYPHRALAWKVEFAEALKQAALDIAYTNFKSEVSKVQGSPRHDLYMRVWSAMKYAEEDMKKSAEHDARGKKSWKTTGSQLGFFPLSRDTRDTTDFAKSRKAREERLRECHARVSNGKHKRDDEPEESLEEALAYSYGSNVEASDEQYWCPECRLFGGHYKGCAYRIRGKD